VRRLTTRSKTLKPKQPNETPAPMTDRSKIRAARAMIAMAMIIGAIYMLGPIDATAVFLVVWANNVIQR